MPASQKGLPQGKDAQHALQQVLGYLNFSSGAADSSFLKAINLLYERALASNGDSIPAWRVVHGWLDMALGQLESTSSTFADSRQAHQALDALPVFVTAYREFHQDLLGLLDDNTLFNSFMWGRIAEILLACGPDWEDPEAMDRAIRQFNDYLGYRPVATLESQKIEPYAHEWLRPIPLLIQDVGPAVGPYQNLIHTCLELLRTTDERLLREAYFDPALLHELSMDPRAYDFDHPANRRPNHHFGQWDTDHIDNKGFYRRFVVQRVTIEVLLRRVTTDAQFDQDELLFEASAVLAGTVLMSSGICGDGPGTHDSTVSLSSLLVRIAAYRDAFYEQLLANLEGPHGARLRQEAERLQQPFAAARQDLNRQLTQCRATQLQRVQLAKIYARMGFVDAAAEQTARIQVPAARLTCEIDCHLTRTRENISDGNLAQALELIERARSCLLRAIECGAIVDPWNILGFDGNFSVFGSLENSLRDYRIEELVELIEEMMEVYAQISSAAAAREDQAVDTKTRDCFATFAQWWYQFAAHELDTVECENPKDVFKASGNVADCLRAWHERGEATGDIGFWAPHVEHFDSCRAYWLVINTLLDRNDDVAALGLLMHWLGQADRIPLEQGETSFFQLSLRWIVGALQETGQDHEGSERGWRRVRRFFDHLEANAGEYWLVPEFVPEGETTEPHDAGSDALAEEESEDEELFSAAYENVVYRDSTDDGIEGSIFDFDHQNEDYLQQVSRPIVDRLAFFEHLAGCWKLIVAAWSTSTSAADAADGDDEGAASAIAEMFDGAIAHLRRTITDTSELLDAVSRYRLHAAGGDPESVMQYDRLRLLKDSLIDQIINTQVQLIEGQQFLLAARGAQPESDAVGDAQAVALLQAALYGDAESVQQVWTKVFASLERQPILYVPLARGGSPKTIVRIKARQKLAQNLLLLLPRIGMLRETYQLIELVRRMERRVPVGSGAITEFDDLFEVGCRELVAAMISTQPEEPEDAEADWLISYLEEMMEPLLRSWLAHSRTLRLSVLEQVMDGEAWDELVDFIRRFGRDLFTQRFLNLGNVRGILHQGVETWLTQLDEHMVDDEYQALLDALEHDLDFDEAVEQLTLILEAIVENYSEYRDYNSTTTQSDRGDLLYSLLDFVRLRTSYDRVVWNLRPIVIAHQVLVQHDQQDIAEEWRASLRERIQTEADRHIARLHELERLHAMRLPSISERLNERFMRPLLVDQLCAQMRPAMEGQSATSCQRIFDQIAAQAEDFMNEPSGAGLDIPSWLLAMEDEVRKFTHHQFTSIDEVVQQFLRPRVCLSLEQIQALIGQWRKTE